MDNDSLQGLIEFISGISYLVIVVAGVAGFYYLAAFGMGLKALGDTSQSMMKRPPEPKEVLTNFIGAILFASFLTVLMVSHNTIIDNQTAFNETPVFTYVETPASASSEVELTAMVVRSSFQMMSLFFLYGAILKGIAAGKSDGSEKGALTNGLSKLVAAIFLWTPELTIGWLDFIPFFDVLASLLAGTNN